MHPREMDWIDEHAEACVANGYHIVPIMPQNKAPGEYRRGRWVAMDNWPRYGTRPPTAAEIEEWGRWPGNPGLGIVCSNVVGIDIDVLDEQQAIEYRSMAQTILGQTPLIRQGQSPKLLLVYRGSTPSRSRKIAGGAGGVDIIGVHKQFVAWGTHPKTGQPYRWLLDDSPATLAVEELPEIDERMISEFLAQIPQDAQSAWKMPSQTAGLGDKRGTYEAIEDALRYIVNADLHYDDWVKIGMAIKGALGDDGWSLFERWSATSQKNDDKATQKAWRSFAPKDIGAGSIYAIAMGAGWVCPPDIIMNGTLADAVKAAPVIDVAALASARKSEPSTIVPSEPLPPAQPPEKRKRGAYGVPSELWQIGGVLGRIVDDMLVSATRPQPWLALGAAICAVGTLASHRYRAPSGLRTNIYAIGVADSGGGKDHSRKYITKAFTEAGHGNLLGGRLASAAGLLSSLERGSGKLLQTDEFGHFLASVLGKRSSPYKAELWATMTELYSSADSVFVGAEYADQNIKPRTDIHQPCLSIFATTVPGPLWSALQSGSVHDGSLARWLLFLTDNDYPDLRDGKSLAIDPDVVALLKSVRDGAGRETGHDYGPLVGADDGASLVVPIAYTVPADAATQIEIANLGREETERLRANTAHRAILARVRENTIKLALVRAISDNPSNPVLTLQSVAWARAVVNHCTDTMIRQIEDNIADNQQEADLKRLLGVIRKAGTIASSDLTRRSQWLTTRQRSDMLTALVEAGDVEIVEEPTSGRPKRFYRA